MHRVRCREGKGGRRSITFNAETAETAETKIPRILCVLSVLCVDTSYFLLRL